MFEFRDSFRGKRVKKAAVIEGRKGKKAITDEREKVPKSKEANQEEKCPKKRGKAPRLDEYETPDPAPS